MRAAIVVMVMMATTPAAAATYQFVGAVQGTAAYVDRDTIKDVPGAKRVWVSVILPRDRADGTAAMQSRVLFDCAGERMKTEAVMAFSAAGVQLRANNQGVDWQIVPPGTINTNMMKATCGPVRPEHIEDAAHDLRELVVEGRLMIEAAAEYRAGARK